MFQVNHFSHNTKYANKYYIVLQNVLGIDCRLHIKKDANVARRCFPTAFA